MHVFNNVAEWRAYREKTDIHLKIGFVPTMGALHQGHLELVRRSKAENDITVVSIFVNPTQFNNSEDFEKYPRLMNQDKQMLEIDNVDGLILPEYSQIYADQYRYKVSESGLSQKLCGASRPGHFDGVLTVVMKLLNIVQPHRAYFGEKDFQQLSLIRGMVEAFFIPTQIIGVPTLRESSGLAMSSRNLRLSDTGRALAANIFRILKESPSLPEARTEFLNLGITVDYIEDIGGRRFAAVWIEGVRLIDNVELKTFDTSNKRFSMCEVVSP